MSKQQISRKKKQTPVKPPGMSQERFEKLVRETQSPFKGLRLFIYGGVGASGLLGAFVFLTQLMAGREVSTALSNLAVQLGVIGIAILLFWIEGRGNRNT